MSEPLLQVLQLSTLGEFALLRSQWNQLAAGVPTRTWEWLESWWRIYGNTSSNEHLSRSNHGEGTLSRQKELYLLAIFDLPDRLVGLAPWYIESVLGQGRVLRLLGSGEVCTDYSTILCEPGYEVFVGQALAHFLVDPLHLSDWLIEGEMRHWDRMEFDTVPRNDVVMQAMLHTLQEQNYLVHRRPSPSCWRINLPATWDEYLTKLSKSHRKQIRRYQRELFDSGRAQISIVDDEIQLSVAWRQLIRLHQLRNNSHGEAGCFASQQYANFHELVSRRLLAEGMLRLQLLELDGQIIGAEYQLHGQDTIYAYQGGIDPAYLNVSPGRLGMIASLRQAIAEGKAYFDLMRGDEEFKAHWRAEPTPCEDVWVAPNTTANQVRHTLWSASQHVKQWIKVGLSIVPRKPKKRVVCSTK